MKTQEIIAVQYADWKDCSRQYISRCIKNNKPLDEVFKVKKYSRFSVLVVPAHIKFNTVEQSTKNQDEKYGKWKKSRNLTIDG